ncbi:hypothetical protein C8R45DRAFT_756331, partial [Mycena sanguinolenta]
GAHLVSELRDRILVWRYEQGKPPAEIAELAGCSERTVYNILQNEREFGQTTNPHARCAGRPRALDMGDIDFLSALLDATPTLYLDELQEKLWDARGVD